MRNHLRAAVVRRRWRILAAGLLALPSFIISGQLKVLAWSFLTMYLLIAVVTFVSTSLGRRVPSRG
jgi:Ca2+/Na+ antiporter